jgi:hypothetical protein
LRIFQIRVLRRIFGPTEEKMVRDWRRLHKEDLQNLNVSLNVIRMIELVRIRWAGM